MISKGCKSIFPIQHQEIFDRYKQQVQSFWTPEEVSLQDDLRDLMTLTEGERHFINHVIAFYAKSESMIYENDNIEGLDSAILTNPLVLKYSGHEDTFSDPMVDCKSCNLRFRVDQVPDSC